MGNRRLLWKKFLIALGGLSTLLLLVVSVLRLMGNSLEAPYSYWILEALFWLTVCIILLGILLGVILFKLLLEEK